LLAGTAIVLFGRPGRIDCADRNKYRFFTTTPGSLRRLVLAGRLPFMFLSLLLALTVYLWSRALFGAWAGLLSLALAVVVPNLLAHGHLAAGDLAVTLGPLVCLEGYWRPRG